MGARELARLGTRILGSNFRDPALPWKLTLILTYRCQLRCTMCDIWKRRPEGELDADELRRFFRANPGFSWVNVSGGEIFLRPDLADLFDAIREECRDLYLLDFPTHGQQTDRIVDHVGRLVASRIPRLYVTVSIDGPPALHDEIRGVDGAFEKAITTFGKLRGIRRRGYRPFLGMTLQPKNADAIEDTIAAVQERVPEFDARELHVNLVHESSHYYGNDGVATLDADAARRAMDRVRKLRGTSLHPVALLERRYQRLGARWLDAERTPLPCHAASSSIFVDSLGNVRPCSIWDRLLGNLRDHDYSLAKLFEAAGIAEVRRDARTGNCPNCWTPCEAYQSILSNLVPGVRRGAKSNGTNGASGR